MTSTQRERISALPSQADRHVEAPQVEAPHVEAPHVKAIGVQVQRVEKPRVEAPRRASRVADGEEPFVRTAPTGRPRSVEGEEAYLRSVMEQARIDIAAGW